MKIKKIGLITAFLLAMIVSNAQESQTTSSIPIIANPEAEADDDDISTEKFDKHEYSVYLLGGSSNLTYKLKGGSRHSGYFGGGAGLAYTYNVTASFGVSTGVEYSTFGGKALYESLSEKDEGYENGYPGIDNSYGKVQYYYTIKNYEETQRLALLSVPIMALFKTEVSGNMMFYAGGGFKFGLPVSASATILPGSVTSSGYYEHENITYINHPRRGFYLNSKPGEQTTKIDVGLVSMLALEAGLRFNFGNTALYTSFYFDYSLNSIKQTKNKHPMHYDYTISYESVLNSSLTKRLDLISTGLKIKFSLF